MMFPASVLSACKCVRNSKLRIELLIHSKNAKEAFLACLGNASLPVFTDIYVPRDSNPKYKDWNKKYNDWDYIDKMYKY